MLRDDGSGRKVAFGSNQVNLELSLTLPLYHRGPTYLPGSFQREGVAHRLGDPGMGFDLGDRFLAALGYLLEGAAARERQRLHDDVRGSAVVSCG